MSLSDSRLEPQRYAVDDLLIPGEPEKAQRLGMAACCCQQQHAGLAAC
jgi:hypothetical protein